MFTESGCKRETNPFIAMQISVDSGFARNLCKQLDENENIYITYGLIIRITNKVNKHRDNYYLWKINLFSVILSYQYERVQT